MAIQQWLAVLTLLLSAGFAAPISAQPSMSARQAFDGLSARYVASIAEFQPTYGTTLGDHRFDDRLPDVSAAGRKRVIAFEVDLLAQLGRLDRTKLDRDRQVDAALLENQLRSELWDAQTQQSWAWDPQIYNDTAGSALYGLAARDFAPWPQRLRAATSRMEALPAFFAEARRQLVPARTPPIMAETVSKQNGGVMEIAQGMLAPHENELSPPDRARFEAALATLKIAVSEQQTWLDTVLVPQAKGDFRLGPKLYDEKMRFALMSDMSRQTLKARAQAAVAAIRLQMYALSRQALANKLDAPPAPAHPTPAQQQAVIEAALKLTYAQRASRDALMSTAEADLQSATAFVRAKGFVAMPNAPVRIITMPKFQQGMAVADDDAPGALEKELNNFVAISPIPGDWTDAQATSFLSEYNAYMINDLMVHEAMPGHYLQLDHANKDPSVLRAVLWSGPFVEGWAVYAEGLMADEGFVNRDPLFALTVLKMRLRSVTNTLLDIGIHTEGMTREQAMDLMMKTAFQQEREAAGKWVRANLSSTQLLNYFTGYDQHMALREEAKQRWGSAYNLRRYNDAVLAHGSPPIRFVRELMFDLPIK
jgi:uncharacterized protein (DUF885 family)